MLPALLRKILKIRPHPCFQACVAYANNTKICVKGHVVECSETSARQSSSFWRPLRLLLRRYLARGIEHVPVVLYEQDRRHVHTTGQDGSFSFEVEASGFMPSSVRLGMEAHRVYIQIPLHKPREHTPYIVVSDVDDTVLKTHATRWWKRLQYLLFYDTHRRKAVPGMQAFYASLIRREAAPPLFFYVSNSEWNLFDLIHDFLKINHFPDGCLLLRERVHHWKTLFQKKHSHKRTTIEHLLEMYRLPFVLIGDSGQQDPSIYAHLVKRYPRRIKGVYLRLIKEKHRHTPRLKQLEAACAAHHIPCHVFTEPPAP